MLKNKESQTPSIFVGIVDGFEPNSISVGIINTSSKTIAHQSFSLSEISLLEIESLFNGNQFIPELEAIVDFIKSQTLQANNVQVLMELPSAVLNIKSIHSTLLMLLSIKGYCGLSIKIDEEKVRLTDRFANEVIYLQKDICKAYAQFLFGSSPSSECAAIFAALIAKNKNLYYFLNSKGRVQSSQDLLEFMKNHEEGQPTAVLSGKEVFITLKLPTTEQDKIEKIPLKYAVAQKKYKFLGENNAFKFALLNVCRLWKIRLYCLSWYDEDAARILNYEDFSLIPDEDNLFSLPERYIIYEPLDELGLIESDRWLKEWLCCYSIQEPI